MHARAVLTGAVLFVVLLLPLTAGASSTSPRAALVLPVTASLYAKPSVHSLVLAELVQQTQVSVLRTKGTWRQVEAWGSLKGWLPRKAVGFRKPWKTHSTYQAPTVHYRVRAHPPAPLSAPAIATGRVSLVRAPGTASVRSLPGGAHLAVTSWQEDARGQVWYEIRGLWTLGPLRFLMATPGGRAWKSVAGKGMWLSLGTVSGSDPDALARAAALDGVTHLYIEAAISPWGFHGRDSVGPLIDAAHRRGLAVIAWVYPYLVDIASDVSLTRTVASFRTAGGERFDGIAADLERNMDVTHIRAYSQLIRYYLGPSTLLIGVTYPPQSIPTYPFAEVAHFYNAIAPMDYWHQTRTATGLNYGHMKYGYAYAYRYARDSVLTIRRTAGSAPIMPIGQTFDNFGRLERGPYAPSADEIRGFLEGSRDSGAAGVSFFQWMTATVPEWQAIRAFRFK